MWVSCPHCGLLNYIIDCWFLYCLMLHYWNCHFAPTSSFFFQLCSSIFYVLICSFKLFTRANTPTRTLHIIICIIWGANYNTIVIAIHIQCCTLTVHQLYIYVFFCICRCTGKHENVTDSHHAFFFHYFCYICCIIAPLRYIYSNCFSFILPILCWD